MHSVFGRMSMARVAIGVLVLWSFANVASSADSPPDPKPATELTADEVTDLRAQESREFTSNPEGWPGAVVYRGLCVNCHQGQVPKAPNKTFLQMMSPEAILGELTGGVMKTQASALTQQQRRDVAEYLAGEKLSGDGTAPAGFRCAGSASDFDLKKVPAPIGWGHDNARFTPATSAGLTRAQVPGLVLKWAFEFPRAFRTRSQPAIAYGAVFTGSQDGTVYALDLKSGCSRWTYKSTAEVRTGIVLDADVNGDGPRRLFFGDTLARVHAVDAMTGKLLWTVKVEDHPDATITGTPTLYKGILYVPTSSLEDVSAANPSYECCKFRGAVVALDASTGAIRWRGYALPEPKLVKTSSLGVRSFAPSGAAIWNSPTIDARRGLIYVGTGENYSSPAGDTSDAILAMRLRDGHIVWSKQLVSGDAWNAGCVIKGNPNCTVETARGTDLDVDISAGTILAKRAHGNDVLLVGAKNGAVYGLDPDAEGRILWQRRVGRGGAEGGVHFGMSLEGDRVFAPMADPPPEPGQRPGLYGLNIATGDLLWSTPADDVCGDRRYCSPGISSAVTSSPGVVFAGHLDGRIRAYDSTDGKVIWEFDSTRKVKTVSGTTAHGGSMSGPGPVVGDGYVVVNSGYGLFGRMPGNVLLVFAASQ